MNWMSLDIADGKSGAVVWEDHVPVTIARLESKTKRATKTLPERRSYIVFFRNLKSGDEVPVAFANEQAAWSGIRNGLDLSFIVLEAGHVHWPGAAMALAEARGRALAILGAFGTNAPTVLRVSPSSWRKGIRSLMGVDIPAKRDAAKRAAIEIVRQLFEFKVTDDEAEAYLIGRWAWDAGRVEL